MPLLKESTRIRISVTSAAGQGDGKIFPELVLHPAALTVAGGDGGVGYKGEVIPEHGPAHDGADAQRQAEAGGRGDSYADGRDEGDGSHGGAHGGGDKTAYHKQHRHGVTGRE